MEISLSSLYWKSNQITNLFHFQGESYISSNLKTQSSTHIYLTRERNAIMTKDSVNSDYLLSVIINSENEYFIQRIPHFNHVNLWFVLNYSYTNQVKGHQLREGEIIRLGKVQFKILESKVANERNMPLVTSNNKNICRISYKKGSVFAIGERAEVELNEDLKKPQSTLDFNTIESTNRQSMGSMNHHDSYLQFICRVCFGDSTQDLLINICNCIGTVKYIHVKCLWKWIITKISFKTHNYLSLYTYKSIQCELCHSEIPEVIMVNNNILNLYQPYNILSAFSEEKEVKYENFVALEHIKPNSNNGNSEEKTIYIINFYDKNRLTMGRSTKSDVHLIDHSINDFHSELSIDDNCIYINDLDSIYGTHLLIENNLKIPLSIKQSLGFQLNNVFISIQLKKSLFWCCDLFNKKPNSFQKDKMNDQEKHKLDHINSSNIVEEYFNEEDEKNKQLAANNQMSNLKNVDVYDKEMNTVRLFLNQNDDEDNHNNNYSKTERKFAPNLNYRSYKDEDRSHIIIHSTLDDFNNEEGTIGSARMLVKNRQETKDSKGNNVNTNIGLPNQKQSGAFNRTLILMNSNRPYYFS